MYDIHLRKTTVMENINAYKAAVTNSQQKQNMQYQPS